MPAWAIPLIIQAAEAAFVGIGTAFAIKQSGGDSSSALMAGVMAALAKIVPSQVVAPSTNPKS